MIADLARAGNTRAESFSGNHGHEFPIVANSRRSLAVQELRTWTCGTVLFVVVGGFWAVRFDLRSRGGPAFRSATATRLARRRGLFRISSSPVLLSPIPLRPCLPIAGAASDSRSAPVSATPVPSYDSAQLGNPSSRGAVCPVTSTSSRIRFVTDPMQPACVLPCSQHRCLRNLVCIRPLAAA